MRGVAFLDGGRFLASGSEDRTVKLWDVARASGEPDVLEGHAGHVESLAFSPDSKFLISGGTDALLRKWDVATGCQLARYGNPTVTKPVECIAVSRDGRFV